MSRTQNQIKPNQPHYRVVHFYKRDYEPITLTEAAARAQLEARRLNSSAACYSQLWKMNNETDGEMIGFFEDGAEAVLQPPKRPTTAKLIK